MKKIEKILRIWFWPIWFLILAFEIGVLLLLCFYFEISKDYLQSWEIGLTATLSLLATFVGIFVPLRVNRNWQKSDEKREMIFALGYIWFELRKNLFVLESLRTNYKFKLILEQIPDFLKLTKMINTKLVSLKRISGGLTDEYFLSTLNSKTFTGVDDDEIYNDIIQAYENIKSLEIAFGVLCEDLFMKVQLLEDENDPLEKYLEDDFRKNYADQLIMVYKEIEFCKKSIKKAMGSVDKKLVKSSIVTSLVARELGELNELPDDNSIIPDPEIIF